MNSNTPLVSCVCVTRNRVPLLRRAIKCFENQTYDNRELILVYESDDHSTCEFVEEYARSHEIVRARCVPAEPKSALGTLRNLAIEASRGEYICQWDDDDWYRQDRLQVQLQCLYQADRPACVLGKWIVFDSSSEQAYWSKWRAWEGSLLGLKCEIGNYPALVRGEDTPVIKDLQWQGKLVLLDEPMVYVYVYHGENTWNRRRWQRRFVSNKRLPDTLNSQIVDALRF